MSQGATIRIQWPSKQPRTKAVKVRHVKVKPSFLVGLQFCAWCEENGRAAAFLGCVFSPVNQTGDSIISHGICELCALDFESAARPSLRMICRLPARPASASGSGAMSPLGAGRDSLFLSGVGRSLTHFAEENTP